MSLPIHHQYLPFTEEQLIKHFADVAGGNPDKQRHLEYYSKSVSNWSNQLLKVSVRRQMEKDERFWVVATLLAFYYSDDPHRRFGDLLARDLGPPEPFANWQDALAGDLHLFFEVNLNSPEDYRRWLSQHLDERVPVPYLREAANTRKERLEGSTKVDAMLLAPDTGCAVLFEAKVLSDTSTMVLFDVMRNQIARNIDVLLEANQTLMQPLPARQPALTSLVLITPQLFREGPESRLYGWLLNAYREGTGLLAKHLPHRKPEDLDGIPARLGWLAWEDCNDVLPGACPWLLPKPAADIPLG